VLKKILDTYVSGYFFNYYRFELYIYEFIFFYFFSFDVLVLLTTLLLSIRTEICTVYIQITVRLKALGRKLFVNAQQGHDKNILNQRKNETNIQQSDIIGLIVGYPRLINMLHNMQSTVGKMNRFASIYGNRCVKYLPMTSRLSNLYSSTAEVKKQ
jgi:hypothetical protein